MNSRNNETYDLRCTNSKILMTIKIIAKTTNPGVNWKPDNYLKGIWNQIPWKPDNPLKGIHNIVPNETLRQWPIGLTIPT